MTHRNLEAATDRSTRLLYCGPAAALLFIGLALVQAIARPGYDLVRHPLSLLAVGPEGWVQTVNFIASGLLVIALAAGVRRAASIGPANVAGAALIALHGCGLVIAGIFPSDPIHGFPLGARQPEAMSSHASMHGMGFMIAQISLILGCLALAYRFVRIRSPGWAFYCLATAISAPAVAALGFGYEPTRGLAFFASGSIGFAWLAALGVKLAAGSERGSPG